MASSSKSGKANHIEVYARVRPSKKASPQMAVHYADSAIGINIPRDANSGYVNNQRENWSFPFSRVLDATALQDQVFETVAQPVVGRHGESPPSRGRPGPPSDAGRARWGARF